MKTDMMPALRRGANPPYPRMQTAAPLLSVRALSARTLSARTLSARTLSARTLSRLLGAAVLSAFVSSPAAAQDTAPPQASSAADEVDGEMRIQIGMKSADEVLNDLEAVVGGLANERQTFRNLVEPNLEIFLEGVDRSRTIRFDVILPAGGERRLNMAIPLSDVKDFVKDNVEPIGINTRRRSDDYYELTGQVYEGWLRIVDNYGVIAKAPFRDDAAAGIPSPAEADVRLFDRPADLAILIDEASGSRETRVGVITKLGEERLSKLTKRADESDAAFNLRRTMAENRVKHLPRIAGDVARLLLGYETVAASGTGRSHMIMEADAGTPLQEMIDGVGGTPFLFAGVPTTDNPVYSGRVAWPMTEARKARWADTLEAARPVAEERLDAREPAPTPERRAAQSELNDAIYTFLEANLDQPLLGGFLEMRSDGGKAYSSAAGLTSVDGTAFAAVLEKMPAALDGATLEQGVETVGEITLHRLTLPNLAPALKEFNGGTSVLVGTSADAIYLVGGANGLELFKTSVADLAPAPTESLMTIRAHVGPVARVLDSVMTKRGFSLIEFLQDRRSERLEQRKAADEARRLQVTDPSAWREAALEALLGKKDDVLIAELKKVDDHLEGDATYGQSILAAVGELIAKFAKENL